jgi:hypothetical protein
VVLGVARDVATRICGCERARPTVVGIIEVGIIESGHYDMHQDA